MHLHEGMAQVFDVFEAAIGRGIHETCSLSTAFDLELAFARLDQSASQWIVVHQRPGQCLSYGLSRLMGRPPKHMVRSDLGIQTGQAVDRGEVEHARRSLAGRADHGLRELGHCESHGSKSVVLEGRGSKLCRVT